MREALWRRLEEHQAERDGVIGREAALRLGLTPGQIAHQLRMGHWSALHRGVYVRAVPAPGPLALTRAACLAASPWAVASHTAAAAMWGLLDPPGVATITVPRGRSARFAGVQTFRRDDLDWHRVRTRNGVPVTDPLRTLADLGEVIGAAELDRAIDRALARRVLSVDGLHAEVDRLGRRGRSGVPQLRGALMRRGLIDPPAPSVLESMGRRLLHEWGIGVLGAEVVVCGGRYRVDFLLRPMLVLEVDGFAYHWSPEAKAADSARRNDLRLAGYTVLEADWLAVAGRSPRLRRQLRSAVAARPAGS